MPEISHVRIAIPDQGVLQRILREGGAQLFPQWLYSEAGPEPRIAWWGLRGRRPALRARTARERRLLPRPVDDWTEAPRGLVLGDRRCGPRCGGSRTAHRLTHGPTPGRTRCSARSAAGSCSAERAGDGPTDDRRVRRWVPRPLRRGADRGRAGRRPDAGRSVLTNPVSGGPATYARIGAGAAPMLIFLPAADGPMTPTMTSPPTRHGSGPCATDARPACATRGLVRPRRPALAQRWRNDFGADPAIGIVLAAEGGSFRRGPGR